MILRRRIAQFLRSPETARYAASPDFYPAIDRLRAERDAGNASAMAKVVEVYNAGKGAAS